MTVGGRTFRAVGLLAALVFTASVGVGLVAQPAFATVTGLPNTSPSPSWGTNGRVLAILPVGNRVYVAGDFTSVVDPSGRTYPAPYLAVYLPASGTFDTSWRPNPNAEVAALAIRNGTLFLGGNFTAVHGHARSRLAAVDALTGTLDSTWTPGANHLVDALAVSGSDVYVGGKFTKLTGSAGIVHSGFDYIGRISAGTGAVDKSWHPLPDAKVRALVASPDGTRIYAGGDFTSISGSGKAKSITSLSTATGALDAGFVSGPTDLNTRPPAFSLDIDNGHLLAAVGGAGGGCAALDPGTGARQWSIHTNGNVQAVTAMNGVVYCGGHFDGSGGVASFGEYVRYKLGAVDEQTGQVLDYAPRFNSALGIWALATQTNTLYTGGDFTKVTRTSQPHFAVMQ